MMKISQENNGNRGKFYIMHQEKQEAVMTYRYDEKNIIIDHTEVNDVFKGQGLGYKLVQAAVDFARKEGIKIKPLCPFANAVFKKKSQEYSDVLFK